MKGLDHFLNERATMQVKRKYAQYDSIKVGKHAPVRNNILSFVNEKGCCSKNDLMEYIKSKNEELGSTTSTKWISKNMKYLVCKTNESGEKTYKLSKLGKRVIAASTISE